MENNLERKMNAIAEVIMDWFGLALPIFLCLLGLTDIIVSFINENFFSVLIGSGMIFIGGMGFKEFYNELKNK